MNWSLPHELLANLLDTSPIGLSLLQPVYASNDRDLMELLYLKINPTAQYLFNSFTAVTNKLMVHQDNDNKALFAFYRLTLHSNKLSHYDYYPEHGDERSQLHLMAQRHGSHLVVSFTCRLPLKVSQSKIEVKS